MDWKKVPRGAKLRAKIDGEIRVVILERVLENGLFVIDADGIGAGEIPFDAVIVPTAIAKETVQERATIAVASLEPVPSILVNVDRELLRKAFLALTKAELTQKPRDVKVVEKLIAELKGEAPKVD